MFPSFAVVFQFVDMMGWRLETADRADILVSFNPGGSSMVADLQELPSTVHSASWVAPLSYLGDKVRTSCCSPEPSSRLLRHGVSIISCPEGSIRKFRLLKLKKLDELQMQKRCCPPLGGAEGLGASCTRQALAPQRRKSGTMFFSIFTLPFK